MNLSLWIVGQVLVWLSIREPGDLLSKIRRGWDRFIAGGFQITPWMILVGGVFAISAFYRFYLLNQVPPEMFSDHAEKLIDVSNLMWGDHAIFFPRNTGREAFQMYLTAAMAKLFGTGISFLSLKLGTCLAGLFSLPFIYLLGKEIASKKVGLLAMFFAGIAYWPNVISRVALRFALYPAFVAPTLYFLVRGLKRKSWNDFLFAGLFLGIDA
jgi:4-amino-4-deoxy-L-arabinose transferase-like glycosyltransferase